MATHDLTGWRHSHSFDAGNQGAETRTWIVVGITAVTMVVEIVAGFMTGSMALLADGWHMSTHVVALSIAGVAYVLARRWSRDERFAFGTWKIEVLGAFSSALLLGVVAVAMIVESVTRLVTPAPISFVPALTVAVIGLLVNLASAAVLGHGHDHGVQGHDDHDNEEHHGHGHHDQEKHHGHGHHEHEGHHGHGHHDHGDHDHEHRAHARAGAHHDLNLRSAYVHVLADAFTSVLAIAALSAGLWLGWSWMDPIMGIVGACVIAWWAKGLITDSARVLLDREMDAPVVGEIRRAIESDGDTQIADLHVWRVGRATHAAVVVVVADKPLAPDAYRGRLRAIPSLQHVSVEVNRCPQGDCP